MTGEMIRDLLQPLIGKSGSIAMVVSRVGHVAVTATGTKKLTGVELRPDGLVRLERETGWAVIDPTDVVVVAWDGEPETLGGQFL
jgi:spore germination protein GerM